MYLDSLGFQSRHQKSPPKAACFESMTLLDSAAEPQVGASCLGNVWVLTALNPDDLDMTLI